MNKKILVVSILAVFTLVAISFASAISSNTVKSVDKKETPLYGIRTRRAIGERLGEIIDYIKTKFLGDRIFFLPFQWLKLQGENPWTIQNPPTFCPDASTCRWPLPCK